MAIPPLVDFPLLSKDDWRALVEKELHGDSYGTMLFVIDDLEFDPYYDATYMDVVAGTLPKRNDSIGLGEYFDFREGKNPINNLLEGLVQGLTTPVVLVDHTTKVEVFKEVQFSILNGWFELSDRTNVSFIHNLNSRFGDNGWHAHWSIDDTQLSIQDPVNYYQNFSFETESNVSDFICGFLKVLDATDDEQLSRIRLTLQLSRQLVHDIVKARAIKIAWCNYITHRQLEVPTYLTFATWLPMSDFPGHIIDYTYQMLAASMAQADGVILPGASGVTDADRTSRNVGQVGLVEAGLDKNPDPVAGSYFIEYVATRLALNGWEAYRKLV